MQKTPSGGPHPSKKRKKKKERERERENGKRKSNRNKKNSKNEKCFACGQMRHFVGSVLLNRDNKPCQSTPGSSGLDLSSTTASILTPVVVIPTGMASPLPEDILDLC